MEIKVIEVFPTDTEKLNNIEMAKAKWFINILRKKYQRKLWRKHLKS